MCNLHVERSCTLLLFTLQYVFMFCRCVYAFVIIWLARSDVLIDFYKS